MSDDEQIETFSFPTVTAIIEQEREKDPEILMLIRKDEDPEYDKTLELPTGKIKAGENPFDAVKREVKEETGLEVIKIKNTLSTSIYNKNQDSSGAFIPFACVWQQIAQKSWAGFVFRCQIEDDKVFSPQNTEVRKIQWMKVSDLQKIFVTEPQKINSFNLGILDIYFQKTRAV